MAAESFAQLRATIAGIGMAGPSDFAAINMSVVYQRYAALKTLLTNVTNDALWDTNEKGVATAILASPALMLQVLELMHLADIDSKPRPY
jgi:hypothetical protein